MKLITLKFWFHTYLYICSNYKYVPNNCFKYTFKIYFLSTSYPILIVSSKIIFHRNRFVPTPTVSRVRICITLFWETKKMNKYFQNIFQPNFFTLFILTTKMNLVPIHIQKTSILPTAILTVQEFRGTRCVSEYVGTTARDVFAGVAKHWGRSFLTAALPCAHYILILEFHLLSCHIPFPINNFYFIPLVARHAGGCIACWRLHGAPGRGSGAPGRGCTYVFNALGALGE